ncbi:MAG: hypothetical protein JNK82_16480 [Myxococcaceae bacterium]|nr:hypothetical protein [Myxococcaceae bacterium]
MACIVFFVGLVLLTRRRRAGRSTAVPIAVTAIGALGVWWLILTLGDMFAAVRSLDHVSPADKATIVAAVISETLNTAALELVVVAPLIVCAVLVDRRLRRLRERPLGPASEAPAGTKCVSHPDTVATHVCSRCGAFMCTTCTAVDGAQCASCLNRPPAR